MRQVTANTVFDVLSRFRAYFQGSIKIRDYGGEEPFHSELYSSDKMNDYGKEIARLHKLLINRNPSDQLLKRLDDNEKTLLEVRNLLVESIKSGKNITPGAEWLLDNFYLIEEQVVLARKHLPKGYSEGLPYLANGMSSGMPRVYNIVLEIISHSDGRVDMHNLSGFIAAYQTCTILTLGELWAIPIMLRLAVIENLRRVCGKIALDVIDNNMADYWADQMIATVREEPSNLILTISDMARSKPMLSSPFVATFTRNLQGKGPALALPLNWMEQQLTGNGVSSNEMVRQENQKQAADQVSVRNSIGTLRFIGATDWREFVESLSSVEHILRKDPDGTYSQMDFATRDRYRHIIESIAEFAPLSETEIAHKVLELASSQKESNQLSGRQRHVGYYLVDKGLKQTERATGVHYTLKHKLIRMVSQRPLFIYLSSIVFLTLCITAGMYYPVFTYNNHSWMFLFFVAVIFLSGSAQLAISLVNWLSTMLVNPKRLPRMDFSKGIPAEYRTLVIVPTMLSDKDYIDNLIEGLEIRFLGNRENNLHFGLLTDFVDADTENLPEDQQLLELISGRIEALNQKYKQNRHDIFFLLHRPRTWNTREKKWMGYERKRGKLAALNALLRGRGEKQFSFITGDYQVLSQVKYVITLDSDTQLPRESAWKFVASMAHPLNRPLYDHHKKRVTEGYGILQPRVDSNIFQSTTSLYLNMQADIIGIDPYTRASSDVYQDLFEEGSFIGKGIYDVDVFEQAVHGVFQENRILSHDLLEGCYARSGLLSDVFLYEHNPMQYSEDIKRHHRWIRGDWQIGAWALPFIRTGKGHLTRNRLSALSRWKIFDNLRRSLLPQSLLLLLLIGWTVLPFPWFWTLAVTIIVLLPVLIASGWQLIHRPIDLTLKAHLSEVGVSIRNTLMRFIFGMAILPYEAYQYTDAILRANWRINVSRRKLLEWTPSARMPRNAVNNIWTAYKSLWIAPLLSLICVVFLYSNAQAILIAASILILWFVVPVLVWRLGKPETEEVSELPNEQLLFLHKTARKTWSFFEQFVTMEDNWLPPDNLQQHPDAVIAHRTSPTNMGLALLANLSAYDFGYIPGSELVFRCSNTLQSMLQLERYKGHFYNWYDTLSMLPLKPRYISTVDSGNLTGHLLTLRQGFLALQDQPVFSSRSYEGLRTIINIITDIQKTRYVKILRDMQSSLDAVSGETVTLRSMKQNLDALMPLLNEVSISEHNDEPELSRWISRLSLQVENARKDLLCLAPWLEEPPVPQRFTYLRTIDNIPSLSALRVMPDVYLQHFDFYASQETSVLEKDWLVRVRAHIVNAGVFASARIKQLEQMAAQCEELSEIEYDFLFDKPTSLLRIGYNVEEQKKDNSFYDLLASEARMGIFVGIAQGKLPQESWFSLGRLLTNSGGDPILLSWSGSMFEYLMPQLVMPSYENTLLYQTCKATVKRQIEYAGQQGVPWGISESAYNMLDAALSYQYRAFGVPGLGLKRGLGDDLVIAPYASLLALMVLPGKACTNLQLLSEKGFEGEYGFFEAVDYTVARLPRGKTHSVIQSYMIHHQGMGLLSLAYILLNKPMQQRFISELRFQAALLLLQERIPRATVFYTHTAELAETHHVTSADVQVRCINTPNTIMPEMQLLSNGHYQVMLTNSGGGYSRWKNIAVTRWREDATKDDRGIFCYIKDVHSGKLWSNTYQPVLHPPKSYEVIFSQGHVEFRRHDYGIDTKTEIVISPEDDTEMRRIRIINRTLFVRVLEITSYAEIVMATQASDEAHPVFSNLFVQTEIIPEHNTIFCTRRPRSDEECPPWVFHLMNVTGASIDAISYETDRMQFIGRGRTPASPQAMDNDLLSGSQGAVLDPIVSIRYRIALKPGQTATIDLIYGIGDTKEVCERLVHKYRDQHLKNRAFELSWTHSQVLLRQINTTEINAQLFDRLAASIIYVNPAFRADEAVIFGNIKGQSGLWGYSVSGDLPIVLLHMHGTENLELVQQMVLAHAYWHLKGLAVDLVIWNEDHSVYRQALQEQILGFINSESVNRHVNRPGNIFVRSVDQIPGEDRILFESVARVIISNEKGTLAEQINRIYTTRALPPLLEIKPGIAVKDKYEMALPDDLLFFNGAGGFTADGKEYKIITGKKETTPAPWVNVIANPDFGSIVSESGSAYTWAVNAHEYRITPWSNDPVSDIGGEAYYLRDEETGCFWSPSSFPACGETPYLVTHGFGYTIFEHMEQGILTEFCVFVDKDLPVKFIKLKIKNQSGRSRTFSATGFMEIILGDVRSKTNMHILSEYDNAIGALLFRNRYNTAFAERVSFFSISERNQLSFTTDRSEFIGRNRNLKDPQAMHRKKLSCRSGASMDPCAAFQVKFELFDGAEKEIVFQVGSEKNTAATQSLIRKLSDQDLVIQSLQNIKEYWREIMVAVQVTTPDNALNLLTNGWLLYQTIACRIFARSGFYQSGGAFGFRDQLQDVLALLHTQPLLVKKQILLHASKQFVEGDVQHWWHPPEGRGVRTHCSDDLLWLPYAVSRYILATDDTDLLKTPVCFLESRLLHKDEDSFYDLPVNSNLKDNLYEHCVRAIKYSIRFGKHGLPLIGSGDWNDGMDKVGNKGLGESVWLAFFLYDVLVKFADTASTYGDDVFSETCKKQAFLLQSNIEGSSWDGQWYKRAYFDNGNPLGSKENLECRIDAIAQSWSVLSGAASSKRARMAMTSLDKYLVNRDMKLIQLLDPPFNSKELDPGYIKGYLPGVRENGGQYSHAAVWALMAFAILEDREKVWELFNMIHPLSHSSNADAVKKYKVEPYVMAADIYANESHKGRGGWTWYTGSSGWMYQFIIGSLLGIELQGNQLKIKPCFPLDWPSVCIEYRFGKAIYRIRVFQLNEGSGSWWKMGNDKGEGTIIKLTDDGLSHMVEVYASIGKNEPENTPATEN